MLWLVPGPRLHPGLLQIQSVSYIKFLESLTEMVMSLKLVQPIAINKYGKRTFILGSVEQALVELAVNIAITICTNYLRYDIIPMRAM
jgi:hypothetical protein